MARNYVLPYEGRIQFAGLHVLRLMRESGETFDPGLPNDQEVLQPVFEWLLSREYVAVGADGHYEIATKGKDVAATFIDRFRAFLEEFDVYCAVDLAAGEFGLARYHDYQDAAEWRSYLSQDRFEDLRVAVAEYRDMDPIEIVFMSFVTEGRFGRGPDGLWDPELVYGKVWEDILASVNTAIRVQDLGFEDDQGRVAGEDVIKDVIAQGQALLKDLRR